MSWVRSRRGEAVRAEAIATARLTPRSDSLEAPRLPGLAPNTASGVSESASDSTATSHSGEDAVFEEARAART
jgi:hypothetical protein